jgi:SagB-type dehydrogenase family enzyme
MAAAMTVSEPLTLPSPVTPAVLADALKDRASCRRFSEQPLTSGQLATMLHCGYGIVGRAAMGGFEFPHRPVPSAGACYPLHVFVLCRSVGGIEPGVFYYEPDSVLRWVNARPPDDGVSRLFFNQGYVGAAAAVIVIAAEWDKTMERYFDRGYRYVMFEVGHVGQNIALCATTLGLGCLSTGGFDDSELATLLGLTGQQISPLYALAVGPKSGDGPEETRTPEHSR